VPVLQNEKHEIFAQQLAKGKSVSQAFKTAGFQPNRGNASRLKANESIKQRLAELKQAQSEADKGGRNLNGRDDSNGQFLKGYSRGGRPLGSRNKLSESFLHDLHQEWQRCGPTVLEKVAKTDPAAFAKLVAGVLPRELDQTLNLNVGLFQEIRDFSEAFKLARQVIGADAPLLIENEPTER
jgi:hypothetical protein